MTHTRDTKAFFQSRPYKVPVYVRSGNIELIQRFGPWITFEIQFIFDASPKPGIEDGHNADFPSLRTFCLIIISTANDLFAGRSEDESVLRLCSVRPLSIAKRRIRFYDSSRDEVVQSKQILVVSKTVQIPSAPGQSAKVLGDGGQQRLG